MDPEGFRAKSPLVPIQSFLLWEVAAGLLLGSARDSIPSPGTWSGRAIWAVRRNTKHYRWALSSTPSLRGAVCPDRKLEQVVKVKVNYMGADCCGLVLRLCQLSCDSCLRPLEECWITQWTEAEKLRPDLQIVIPDTLASSRKLLTLRNPLGSGAKGIGNPHSWQNFNLSGGSFWPE